MSRRILDSLVSDDRREGENYLSDVRASIHTGIPHHLGHSQTAVVAISKNMLFRGRKKRGRWQRGLSHLAISLITVPTKSVNRSHNRHHGPLQVGTAQGLHGKPHIARFRAEGNEEHLILG